MGKSDLSLFVGASFFLLFLVFTLFNIGTLETLTGHIVSADSIFSSSSLSFVDRHTNGSFASVLAQQGADSDLSCSFLYSNLVNAAEHHFNISFVHNGHIFPSGDFQNIPFGSLEEIKDQKGARCYLENTDFTCRAFLTGNDLQNGEWGCLISFYNASDSLSYLVPKTLLIGSSSGAPYLTGTLPRSITLDANGEITSLQGGSISFRNGFVLDLSKYFEDGNNSALSYRVSGQRNLDIDISSRGIVSFLVPPGFEGAEQLIFFAYADQERVVAPPLNVTVGSGVSGSLSDTCVPFWTCSAYAVCVDGLQLRTCVDQHACGSIEGKPVESQSCRSDSSSSSTGSAPPSGDVSFEQDSSLSVWKIILLIFALLFLLGLAGGGAYWIYYTKKQKMNPFTSPSKESPSSSSSSGSVSNADALNTYIRSALAQHQDPQKIRSDLLAAGWPADLVSARLQELPLLLFIEQKRKLGFSIDIIKKSLLDRGWKKELVDKVCSQLK